MIPPQKRPTAVLVLAILHFVFGGLNVFGLCGGLIGLAALGAMRNIPPPPGGGPNPIDAMWKAFDAIPGGIPLMVFGVVQTGIEGIVLIVAGLGLLKVRPWARYLSIGYGLYVIPSVLANTVYQIVYVNPAMQQWAEEFAQQTSQQTPGGPPPTVFMPWGGGASTVMTLLQGLFGIAYPVVVLAILFLPHVKAAFLPGSRYRPRYDEAEGDEFEDEPAVGDQPSAEDDRFEAGPER